MSPADSVSCWIEAAKAGNADAVQRLWERYYPRLVAFARTRLQGRLRAADEEDAALSAFHSFCRGAECGHFPLLRDRDNLWPLLLQITAHKAANMLRAERAAKRGGGEVRGESALIVHGEGADSAALGIERILCEEPTPELAAQLVEEHERLLEALGDPTLKRVALWKMEGHSNEEIAGRLGVVVRTVERKLGSIRKIWSDKGGA